MKEEQTQRDKGRDPFAPKKGDSPIISEWRKRMGTAAAKDIDKLRPSIAEFPNAVFRNRGLSQFLVRGTEKVKAAVIWQTLAFNFTRIHKLGWMKNL